MRKLLFVILFALASAKTWGACNVLITTFGGAVGNGTTDNTTAIQNTFNYAHTNGCSVQIPAGSFAYSNVLIANGIAVSGLGPASILKATNTNNEALEVTGNGGSVTNLVMLGTGTSRNVTYQAAMIWVNGATNFTIANNLINGGSCVGIYDAGGQTGLIQNNTVENTLADSITNTNGASGITDSGNLVLNSGDDGISNNSYVSDGSSTVNHITITGNTILNNAGGRGMEVSGGNNITYSGNYVDNKDQYADLYIASESEFNTQSVSAITASGNTLVDGGPNQGSAIIYNSQGSGQTISGVTLNGNRFYNPALSAVQYAGNGALTSILVENSSAYTTTGFSFSSNTHSGNSITETSNTVSSPSSYPGPLSAAVGGTVPIFSLPAGSYFLPQSLTLAETTSGDTISYCTTAGSSCIPATTYASAIPISLAETVCADGVNSSSLTSVTSAVVCARYTSAGTTYNVNNSMSASTISATAATAAASAGSTVQFAAGTYALSGTLNLPCTNGVIYQGIAITEPNISNVPAVVLTGPNASSYSINVPSNGTGNSSYTAGCEFKYLGFSGQHGGIYVNYPASGMNIQYNYFTLNDGKYVGGSGTTANQNIHLGGNCPSSGSGNLCGASLGVSWIQVDSNVFYNQCATIRAQATIDSQASCSAVYSFGYNNHETFTNNIVDLIEEGFKWQEVYYKITNVSNNLDVENNNMSGNSRILMENQQNSNGNAVFSHNAHYQPYNPGFNTFEDSIPMNQASPAAILNDNVYIGNVPITFGGSGAHYGLGQEVWGAGMNGQWNVSQGGNSTGTGVCAGYTRGGFFCNGWGTIMGGNNAGQSWTNNYYSGADVWTGTANNVGYAVEVEDGASLGNATLNPNTVVQTSTTLPTATPVISPNGGSYAGPVTVTLSDPDSVHRNVSIFYTTDGSTPAPFVIGGSAGTSQVYTGPFVVPLGTTVKAIAQWGQGANQGISFPSFGWVPSSVTSQTYSSGGRVTLQSVSVAGVGGATVQVGSKLQLAATCHYSDGSTTPCNTLDTHGNVVTAWSPSNGNLTINSSGLATGVSIGTTNVTATVTGGLVSTLALAVTVSASPLTLSSVSLATTSGVSSLATMQTNQLISTCHYNDGSSTACDTVDSHGNAVSTFSSSVPASATVNTSGLVSGVAAGSTNLTASVIPAPAMLGSNVFTTAGSTSAGYINYNYGVTGTAPGTYTPGACQIYVPAMSWTAGQFIDCILTLATSPTTQASSAFCSNRFTTTGSSWPGGFIGISMASCPGLPQDTAFWLGNQTNIPGTPGQGFNNCGGGCNGVVPTEGSGTYGYWYVANPTMGNYTGMTTALLAGSALQVSEYLTLTTNPITSANLPLTIVASPPTLLSAYLTAGGSSLVVPNTLQMAAKCHYSSGADQDCTVADIYGDAVTQWNTSDATKATIGAVGSASPGLVTAVAAGTASITARIAGTGPTSTAYPITITNAPVTLTGISLSTAGGVTGLFVGSTNHLKATCTYSDGSSDDCTATDAHGNLAHSYTSTTPAHATVNATSGLVTGVAAGSTTFTAVAGSFTSGALPLAVFPVLSGIYTITITGPVKFSGTVRF